MPPRISPPRTASPGPRQSTGDTPPVLVLASSSPRRRVLLEAAGFHPVIDPSGVDELDGSRGDPADVAAANARTKTLAVAARRPAADVVLGADTVVVFSGRIFGKPADFSEARAMLGALAGSEHDVVTAVCITRRRDATTVEFAETSRVVFRPLDPEAIDGYLASIDPLDKAGGYSAQDDGGRLIERVDGPVSNVVGLPVERVVSILESTFQLVAHAPR